MLGISGSGRETGRSSGWLESALAPATTMEDRQALEMIHVGLSELEVLRGCPTWQLFALSRWPISKAPVARLFRPTWPGHIWSEGRWNVPGSLPRAVTRGRERREQLMLADALRVQGMVLTRRERYEDARRVLEEGSCPGSDHALSVR